MKFLKLLIFMIQGGPTLILTAVSFNLVGAQAWSPPIPAHRPWASPSWWFSSWASQSSDQDNFTSTWPPSSYTGKSSLIVIIKNVLVMMIMINIILIFIYVDIYYIYWYRLGIMVFSNENSCGQIDKNMNDWMIMTDLWGGWSHSCDCSFRSRKHPCFGHISQTYIIKHFFTFGNDQSKCLRMVFVGPFTNKDKWMSQIGLLPSQPRKATTSVFHSVRGRFFQSVCLTRHMEGIFTRPKKFSLGPQKVSLDSKEFSLGP